MERKNYTITFKVTTEEKRQIERLAAVEQCSVSDLVRRKALSDYENSEKRNQEVLLQMKQLGDKIVTSINAENQRLSVNLKRILVQG